MCTAVTFHGRRGFYMGRTLDYERSFGEQVVVTPRRFPLRFRHGETLEEHYALVGMAHVAEGWPLYYDAVNEKGLGMAGLLFPESGRYGPPWPGWRNAASFELIPWVLGRCATASEARELLAETRVTEEAFSPALPTSPLHWLAADEKDCFAAEPTASGLVLRSDPAGVLTNEPPLDVQLLGLRNYRGLSAGDGADTFAPGLTLSAYSRGMGALGLPGDLSSPSRFVRAAFTRGNALPDYGVGQVFHILGAVAQTAGCCRVAEGFERSIYTAVWDAKRGVYYYAAYENRRLTAVDMHRTDLDGTALAVYPLRREQDVRWE